MQSATAGDKNSDDNSSREPDVHDDEIASKNPWLQAGRIAFIALYVLTIFSAAQWLGSNVQKVDPGNRAVVVQFGAIDREQTSGLLWAWPQPIDSVILVPSAETVLERHVTALLRSQRALNADAIAYDDDEGGPISDALAGSGYLLTGDGAVVQLDVRVFYKVTEPRAYVLQDTHVLPALDRLVTRSAVLVCSARDLDTILVARPELLGSSRQDAEQRERLRSDLLAQINQSLLALSATGVNLGIEAIRVDVQSSLPRATLNAFNAVLTASQQGERAIADARSDAARIVQVANQTADRNLQVASATASERVAKAQSETANILYLAESIDQGIEPGLLMRVYRERIPGILQQSGAVNTVDARSDAQLIISGAER